MAKERKPRVSFADMAANVGSGRGVACPTCGCVRSSVVWSRKFTGLNRRSRKCENPSCGRQFQTQEKAT